MNEYFQLIEDTDLNGKKDVSSWIWECPTCGALFRSKAIPNRTIFAWFGYHPNDGNCKVITDDTARKIDNKAYSCDCPEQIKRVTTVKRLKQLIKNH